MKIHLSTLGMCLAAVLLAGCKGGASPDDERFVYTDADGAPDGDGVITYDYRSTVCLSPLGKEIAFDYPSLRDRTGCIFYFIWHGNTGETSLRGYEFDVSNLEKVYGVTDCGYDGRYNITWGPKGTWYYWGRPYLDYYRSDDRWVIRKHAQQLLAAGIEVICLDLTNSLSYKETIRVICDEYLKMRAEGNPTPTIAPVLNDGYSYVMNDLKELYDNASYAPLWYRLDGKPLILGPSGGLPSWASEFTFRQCWFDTKFNNDWWGNGVDKWSWGDYSPQREVREEMAVMAAGHPMYYIGRSFLGDWGTGYEPISTPQSRQEGAYFNAQFKRAVECDPDHIFVTGWNELLTNKQEENPTTPYFTDNYNHEYSRDVEPIADDFTDVYYYYMADWMRVYKGVVPVLPATSTDRITIDGNFEDWQAVNVRYSDFRGDNMKRNARSASGMNLVNNTGRNDIIFSKVACDGDNLYFYVKCAAPITASRDKLWMQLLLGVKDAGGQSWEGFQWMVAEPSSEEKTSLLAFAGDWNWECRDAELDYRVHSDQMEVKVPLSTIGIASEHFTVDFKWVDNALSTSDIKSCMKDGDSAPDSRWRYRYIR